MDQHQDLTPTLRDWLREPDGLPSPRIAELGPLVHQTTQQRGILPPLPRRFQIMLSATKFLVAGAVLALASGFLLTGTLSQPNGDRLPVGASAKATARALPTDATPARPEPTADAQHDDFELLPGVQLDVERVGSGIYRVRSDGHTDLTDDVWQVEVEDDGEAWVLMNRVTYEPRKRYPEELRVRYGDTRVLVLGEPGPRFRGPKRSNRPFRLSIVDGQIRLDGRAWTQIGWRGLPDRECAGQVLAGGCWTIDREADGISRTDLTDLARGVERIFTRADVGIPVDRGFGSAFALDDEGTVWTAFVDGKDILGPMAQTTGLASWDGSEWTIHGFETGVPGHPMHLLAGSDGSVWMLTEGYSDDGRANWIGRWDGSTWSTLGRTTVPKVRFSPSHRINESPDGTVWFGPLAFWDGARMRQIELPMSYFGDRSRIESYSYAPDGSVWTIISQPSDEPKDPRASSCGPKPHDCQSDPGLYLITPEAAANAE